MVIIYAHKIEHTVFHRLPDLGNQSSYKEPLTRPKQYYVQWGNRSLGRIHDLPSMAGSMLQSSMQDQNLNLSSGYAEYQ